MSAAAAVAPISDRRTSDGWFRVPRSVAENLDAFTHAELALLIAMLRKGTGPVSISDTHWQNWTGLDPKSKNNAIRGLSKKGLMVEGRGARAKLAWDHSRFHAWVREQPRKGRVHTEGRKTGVDARPGAKVHPECREKGCAKLFGCDTPEQQNGLSLVPPSEIRKPVSNPLPAEVAANTTTENNLRAFPSTQVRKPVSEIELLWPATLAAGRKYFPLVGKDWLRQLVASVRQQHGAVNDADVAAAVKVAWGAKNPRLATGGRKIVQDSPGLFYLTVPEALHYVLDCRARGVDPLTGEAPKVDVLRPAADVGAGVVDGIKTTIGAVVDAIKNKGAAFTPIIEELTALESSLSNGAKFDEVLAAEEKMAAIERRLVDCAVASFAAPLRTSVEQYVRTRCNQWRSQNSKGRDDTRPLPEGLESSILRHRVLELLSCPRLALVFA